MVADVPLGVFLSGGIHSSTIAALMQAASPTPIRTFAIGFHEQTEDEAHHEEIAAHLGTDHTELYVTPAEALAVIRNGRRSIINLLPTPPEFDLSCVGISKAGCDGGIVR